MDVSLGCTHGSHTATSKPVFFLFFFYVYFFNVCKEVRAIFLKWKIRGGTFQYRPKWNSSVSVWKQSKCHLCTVIPHKEGRVDLHVYSATSSRPLLLLLLHSPGWNRNAGVWHFDCFFCWRVSSVLRPLWMLFGKVIYLTLPMCISKFSYSSWWEGAGCWGWFKQYMKSSCALHTWAFYALKKHSSALLGNPWDVPSSCCGKEWCCSCYMAHVLVIKWACQLQRDSPDPSSESDT